MRQHCDLHNKSARILYIQLCLLGHLSSRRNGGGFIVPKISKYSFKGGYLDNRSRSGRQHSSFLLIPQQQAHKLRHSSSKFRDVCHCVFPLFNPLKMASSNSNAVSTQPSSFYSLLFFSILCFFLVSPFERWHQPPKTGNQVYRGPTDPAAPLA